MTDYAELRAALEAGPTPGPWTVRYDYVVQATSFDGGRLVPVAQPYGVNSDGTDLFANARMIAACHPEAIRALLADADRATALEAANSRLREALKTMVEMVEMNGFGKDYAIDMARAALAQEES